ncbi:endoglucanase [Paenibacillus mucilaginosus 3016]|uniref:Endoglucanase n=1 Tax=Paenibacillus mucilaginosus 3016 TaxID=1116391 RepID=H6N8X7_9BACL|nr:S-layer homology domain-containing protein [Paenibacillus mucilaginosus]AFC27723.1 endoglucanase [Paenibacillus mucilaginosus 3016]WFA16600.1 S-layer homology domain-containing protein [Paenibacillus mucilaginosus]
MNILRDELKKTRDGYVITIYLSEDRAEFAKELGDNPEQQRELQKDVESYVRKKYPNLKVTTAKVLLGGLLISTIPLGGQAQAATPTGGPKDIDKSSSWAQTAIWNLVDKKIIEGDEQGNFNPQGTMTRDAFTAMLVRALVPADQMVTPETPTFKDIPKDHWAYAYVETAVAKGLVNGTTDTTFSPTDNVTREQMATIFVRALNVPADELKGMGDKLTFTDAGSIADYAKDAVGYAVSKGLMQGTSDTTFDPGKNATREQVAVVMDRYLTGGVVTPPTEQTGKVSVSEAKATGVQTVTVTFNRDVTDAEKATLALTKGNVAVATTAKWSDDKKSAVLTLTDTRLSAGTYTVTLGGLAADAVEKTTAEFTAENETVSKIEFVNANDTIAKGSKVLVNIKASNQYGENASFSSASYTVYSDDAANAQLKKLDNGELQLSLDTSSEDFKSGISVVPVNIYHTDTRVTATKNFKVGTDAFISKVELGTVKYSTGGDSISGKGETATVDLLQYDQYGNIMDKDSVNAEDINITVTPYEENLKHEIGDFNNDDVTDIRFSLANNVDRTGDFTFNVYSQAGTATGTVKVSSTKLATKVEIGDMNNVIAAGDEDAYIPIVAYDAAGNKLSTEDLISDENAVGVNGEDPQITFSVAGATSQGIQTTGEHKGMLKLTDINDSSQGVVTVTAMIATPNANSVATKSYTLQDARTPDTIKVKTDLAKKILPGAEAKFEYAVYDQYGQELDTIQQVDNNGNVSVNGFLYRVAVVTSNNGVEGSLPTGFTLENATATYTGDLDAFNDENKLILDKATAVPGDIARVKVVLQKATEAGAGVATFTDIAHVTRDVEVVAADADLSYSISPMGDLYNTLDSDAVSDTDVTYAGGTLTVAEQKDPTLSKLAKEIELVATDAAGDKVALPDSIQAVYTDNPAIARAGVAGDNTAYVIGNQKGTAKVSVSFLNNEGETVTKNFSVTVKDDALTATKIEAGETEATVAQATPGNAFNVMNLKITDNYGITYENETGGDQDASKYNYLFGTTFGVTNVKSNGADNTVSVDQYGNLTIGANVTGFELTATTAAGLTTTTSVIVTPPAP